MGGGFYENDVSQERTDNTRSQFENAARRDSTGQRTIHADLNIKGKERECRDSAEHPETVPIVIVTDITLSRGDDPYIIYEKLPLLMGQLQMKGYIAHPSISFAAVGDATDGDKAPIQVGQFESDERLDQSVANIWLERGGGGSGQESYELMAYYYAKHSILDALEKRNKKGYFFFILDEGFYPKVSKAQVKEYIGDDLPDDIPSIEIFNELQKKFNVFIVYPKQKWQDRKGQIDEEIRKRVEEAGGMIDGVDVRASLIWGNRNDLDLHCITPDGSHIYYGDKKHQYGELDVDRNVRGETTKPVENIRWPKGKAPKGHYKFFVQNYAFHDPSAPAATPFKVEIEINGKIQHIEGETKRNTTGSSSDVQIIEFEYDPNERPVDTNSEQYAGYDDALIKTQWGSVIPKENILIIEDPRAIIDVMIGALAIMENRSLEDFMIDMQGRGQNQKRIGQVNKALLGLSNEKSLTVVDTGSLPGSNGKNRDTKNKRI